MKKRILYPYTLERKGKLIKLEIKAGKNGVLWKITVVLVFLLTFISLIGTIFFAFLNKDFTYKEYFGIVCVDIICILIILYLIFIINWRGKGVETFILHPDKLEHIIKNKPFKTEKRTHNFSEIRFSAGEIYNEDIYEEQNLDSAEGNYNLWFLMNGEELAYSERKVPAEAIRQMRVEYIRINPPEKEL